MSDLIDDLPIDNSAVSYEEEARLSPLIEGSENVGFFAGHKLYIIGAALFLLLSLPIVDSLFRGISQNGYFLALIKAVVFAVLLYISSKMI